MMAKKIDSQSMSLSELLFNIADVSSLNDDLVFGLALDSRDIKQGYVFVALQGASGHGIEFARTAIDNGAVAILQDVTEKNAVISLDANRSIIPVITVENLGGYVSSLSYRFYGNATKNLNVIGVTGTNGKTTCSQYIAQALNSLKSTAVMGTLGNGFLNDMQQTRHTTPDNISVHRLLNDFYVGGAKHVVMEVSSHGLDQGRVENVNFKVAMFTNLTQDHLDYHASMEEYAAAKRKLFEVHAPSIAVINVDDEYGATLMSELPSTIRKVSYSLSSQKVSQKVSQHVPHAFVRATGIEQSNLGMSISIDSSWGVAQLNTPLLGRFNASNLLGTLAVLLSLDMSIDNAIKRLQTFVAISGRMETVTFENQPLVVIDYAHTPDALMNVLQATREHTRNSQKDTGKIFCVFGCGGDRDKSKRSMMGRMAQKYADRLVITDDNPRTESADNIVDDILTGINKNANSIVIHDRQNAIRYALQQAKKSDIVVIAGKGHEEYQLVGNQKIGYPSDMSIATDLLKKASDQMLDEGGS